MFDLLPNFWTPVLPANHLGDRPVGVKLAGEKIALFRGKNGLGALLDSCPHRGVALSGGAVVDGCLTCPFHGWRFSEDGVARHIPFNEEQSGHRRAVAVPVREIAGMIWVFTGLAAVGEPALPEAASRPGVHLAAVYEDWRVHWTRAMENMLDTPHLPYVHRRTIGAGMARGPQRKMVQEIVPNEKGWENHFVVDDGPPSRIDWLRPNAMELHILDQPGRFLRNAAYCVPLDAHTTRMIILSAWDFGIFSPLFRLGQLFNNRVLAEDRAILESSDPPEVPRPSAEQHVPTDTPTLRFRRWYFENLVDRAAAP
jgi:phenylpropionate dioxygenase-like ring-hydroxylating dioxygenase large terminal subunit